MNDRGQCIRWGCPRGYETTRDNTCVAISRRCEPGFELSERGECVRYRCPSGYERGRDNACVAILEDCPRGYLRSAAGACYFPTALVPVPDRPTTLVPLIPTNPGDVIGRCSPQPGTGPEFEILDNGRTSVQLTRGSLSLTNGSRQRQMVRINDLPASLGSRDISGTRMFADAYVSVPAQANTCRGSTPEGGIIRVVDLPMIGGGTAAACVQFCPVNILTPPKPTSGTPAIETSTATPWLEPRRPAVPTVYATPHTEPKRLAVSTALATPYTEPKRLAVATALATAFTEPRRSAVPTLVANPTIEQKRMAVPTAVARPTIEPAKSSKP